MNRSFYNGVGGTKAHQFAIDTWANNIANISTSGFKANIPQFAELFSTKVAQINNQAAPVASDAGNGVRANSSAISMKTGSIMPTDRELDVALGGEGWFGVMSSDGEAAHFTRNGSLMYNRDGDIVNADGGYMLGTLTNELKEGVLKEMVRYIPLSGVDTQEPLKLPQDLRIAPVPTRKVTIHGNLGAEGQPASFNTNIFARNGDVNVLKLRIEKTSEEPNKSLWNMYASIENKEGKKIFEAPPAPIVFGSNGAVESFQIPVIKNGDETIELSIGEGFSGLVTLGGNLIDKSILADGVPSGKLTKYHFNRDGHIIAAFDNGRESAVGKLAVYHFANDQGLEKLGDNRFSATANSGAPLFYKNAAGENILGTDLIPYALELSNTSAAQALTELIMLQKAFDANAKAISTSDQLIQQALKMV
ncbi:MAG: hypothetical protein KU37_02120 [Sulfuricurvum sp. PC08-66]|nr:MAG: hypothetical protein KU37_02120 [Sulfuricurvum sp. PC08-66]